MSKLNLIRETADRITVRTAAGRRITLSREALRAAEATGSDLDADIAHVHGLLLALPIRDAESIAGVRSTFRGDCLSGCDDVSTETDWIEYADAICAYAEGPDDRDPASELVAEGGRA